MAEEFIDVNVHPNKIDVRFIDNQSIYNTIHEVVKSIFNYPSGPNSIVMPQRYPDAKPRAKMAGKIIKPDENIEKPINKLSEIPYSKNQLLFSDRPNGIWPKFFNENNSGITKEEKESSADLDKVFLENKKYIEELEKKRDEALKQEEEKTKQDEMEFDKQFTIVGQALKTYIILERDGDLYFVDQHAAHERLLFDKITENFKNNTVDKQPLLVPYYLNINDSEYDFVINMLVPLRQLGFYIVESGYNEFCIYEIPAPLVGIDLKEFFDDFLSDLNFRKEELPDVIRDKLAQKSCKAAIKSGKTLSESEIKALINALNSDLNLKCPHGRPIALKITRKEIDKWFKRIV